MSVGIEFCPRPVDSLHDLPIPQLMDLCLGRDATEEAWNEFVKRIQAVIAPVIINSLRRWTTPSRDKVDEVVQRTLLKLVANECKALRLFEHRHENSFPAFLRVVASRAAEDYRRELAHPVDQLPEFYDTPDPRPGQSRSAVIDEIFSFVRTESTELEFLVFCLYYKLGLTAKEISELTCVNLGVKEVEYILWRQMQLLREKFRVGSGNSPAK